MNIKKEKYFLHQSSFVDEGAKIGKNTKIWHFSHVMPSAEIGNDCVIGQNVFIGSNVRIGNRVKIQNNVSLYEGVILADDVFCGPSCVFTNVINPRSNIERKDEYLKTHVGTGASIGANATIICGNNLGDFSFIGAGAVITKNVASYSLMVGNPAKRIGWMSKHGTRLDSNLQCPITKEKYRYIDDELIEEIL